MNGQYFDKARAEDRARRIREESEAQQVAARFSVNGSGKPDAKTAPEPEIMVLRPRYLRSVGLSIIIVIMAVVMLLMTTGISEAQTMEPGSSPMGDGGFHDAMLTFVMGNIAYVREDYEKALTLFTEAIEMVPQEVFELDPTYGHMYKYLGAVQMKLGMVEEAMESYTLYVAYTGEDADPLIIELVEAERS